MSEKPLNNQKIKLVRKKIRASKNNGKSKDWKKLESQEIYRNKFRASKKNSNCLKSVEKNQKVQKLKEKFKMSKNPFKKIGNQKNYEKNTSQKNSGHHKKLRKFRI